jgi:omega-6 fatty acid desaturase (delta-12 desaturase)
MSSIGSIREKKRAIILQHARSDDVTGLTQVLLTLALLIFVWWFAMLSLHVSLWLTAPAVLLISLFSVRVFALMHECGHASLFRGQRLNRVFGFSWAWSQACRQYVWSRHHDYHHAHNGGWEKYRGLYTTLSVDEYTALTDAQQRIYRGKCSIFFAPLAGLIYLIFNPRFNWLKGSIGLLRHIVRGKIAGSNLCVANY